MKYLAEILYEVSNDNPLSLFQWEASANPNSITQHLSWNYSGIPAVEMDELTNKIGAMIPDTGRTGFILACDLIADVTVSDTMVNSNSQTTPIVFAVSSIKDEIKGTKIPLCVGYDMRNRGGKDKITTLSSYVIPWATYAVPADTGSCLDLEYSTPNGNEVPSLTTPIH